MTEGDKALNDDLIDLMNPADDRITARYQDEEQKGDTHKRTQEGSLGHAEVLLGGLETLLNIIEKKERAGEVIDVELKRAIINSINKERKKFGREDLLTEEE